MAIYKEDFIDIELTATLSRTNYIRLLGEADSAADRFGVRLFKNGEAESSIGSCTGYFVRKDGVTLILPGVTTGNMAYVDLPLAAYAVTGQFTLAIKVSGTGYSSTVRVVDGTVIDTTTGTVSDPSSVIPSVADLEAIIAQAEAAADAVNALTVAAQNVEGTRYRISVTKE